jgi:hypothetical protein
MARYVLEVTSRSGKRLPGCTGSHTSIAIYDLGDLKKRLAAAAKNPDYAVTVRDLDEEGRR